MKKKIIILGKYGQLAKSLNTTFKHYKIQHVNISSKNIDFNYPSKIQKKLLKYNAQIIINCFAYTNVDQAEKEKKKCFRINVKSLEKLAKFCKDNNIFLIHFSTDYIFNSKFKKPINENTKKNPINYYGKSKLYGEKKIVDADCKYLIFRLSWTYSIFGNNFVKTIIKNLNKRKKIKIVSDQFGTPTNLEFVSVILVKFIKLIFLNKIEDKNIFNISSNKTTNWYNFAKLIEKNLYPKKKSLISKIKSKDYKTLAKRPVYSKLSNSKLKIYLKNYKFTSWDKLLKTFMNKYKKKLLKL